LLFPGERHSAGQARLACREVEGPVMSRFQWFGLATGVMLAWLATAIRAQAQNPAAPAGGSVAGLRREVSEMALGLLKAQAEADELKDEERLLAKAPESDGEDDTESRLLMAPDELWIKTFGKDAAGQVIADRPLPVIADLDGAHKKIDGYQRDSIDAWSAAMDLSLDLLEQRAKVEADVGWAMGASPPRNALPGHLIAWGVIAVLGSLALLMHEVRDRLRWRLRALGSRPSALAIAALIPLVAVLGASPGATDAVNQNKVVQQNAVPGGRPMSLHAELSRQRDELKQKLDDLKERNKGLADSVAHRLEECRHEHAAFGLQPEDSRQKGIVARAESVEAKVQERFRDIRISARTTINALKEAKLIEDDVKTKSLDISGFLIGSQKDARNISLIRLAVAGLFMLGALVPLSLVRRRHRKERIEQARMCPRCLNKDTLDFANADADVDGEGQTMFRLKFCNACNYEIRENYISQNRLCFPTVGIPYSGKTHWLLMLYDQIKNSNIPVASAIRKIPSREDARFDQLVQGLLYAGVGLQATIMSLPYPLTFHVNDADPLGANRSMVNLFDFSGELRNFDIDTDEFRRRALLCEGFTLFLDPTQVSEGASSMIESQIECLTKFAEEMHAIRGLSAETPIDVPIAVCVSKIDLLITRNPLGTQAVPLVTALRDSMTRKVDLSLIHERSQLLARVMTQLFPSWNVERSLRENFGGRYMFFPMSAVGLEGAELGVEDVTRRTIAPCGMIEPLLWLLHMHGYCVLH